MIKPEIPYELDTTASLLSVSNYILDNCGKNVDFPAELL
jgi:hypothetical protein